jgi:hypothetical protein
MAPNPNQQKDWNMLPGMEKWDGTPFHDFRRMWFAALIVSLGAIAQDGWTLLQTARDQDAGGPTQGGGAQQQQQSTNRNIRLHSCILNYIKPKCAIYKIASSDIFSNDGRGLYSYIWEVGHLGYTQREKEQLNRAWDEATMSNVQIKFTPEAIFEWKEWVMEEGAKSGKDRIQQRTKFLSGFPDAFDVIIMTEKLRPGNGSYLIPADYPAHFPAAVAGQPYPGAGEPDIEAMALAFYTPWADMINKGKIKAAPKGSVYLVETEGYPSASDGYRSYDDEDKDERIFALSKDEINSKFVCVTCGGRGHVSQVNGIVCATKQLGIRIDREELMKTKYPDGITFPKIGRTDHNSAKFVKGKKPNRFSKQRRTVKLVLDECEKPTPTQEVESSSDEDGKQTESANDHYAQMAVVYDNVEI